MDSEFENKYIDNDQLPPFQIKSPCLSPSLSPLPPPKHRTPPKLPRLDNRSSSICSSERSSSASNDKVVLPPIIKTPNKLRISNISPLKLPKVASDFMTRPEFPNLSPIKLPKSPILTPRLSPTKNVRIPKQLFMSHTWRYDDKNRDTHYRTQLISDSLRKMGYTTWYDEDEIINGNIDFSMMNGIDECECFITCLTNKYIQKINYASKNFNIRDNCYKEFNYANLRQKRIIPLVLEELVDNSFGVVDLYIGNQLKIDFSFDNYNSDMYNISLKKLDLALRHYNIKPKIEKIQRNILTEKNVIKNYFGIFKKYIDQNNKKSNVSNVSTTRKYIKSPLPPTKQKNRIFGGNFRKNKYFFKKTVTV